MVSSYRSSPIPRAFLVALLILTPALAQQPVPGRPGYVLVGDIIMHQNVVWSDSTYAATAWPNGVVPYIWGASVTNNQQNLFMKAMAEIEAIADVTFVPWNTSMGFNRIFIVPNPSTACPDDCSSADLGMIGGTQFVNVGSNHWNNKYVLVHELFHTLGFLHEQSRVDRNTYVTINTGNISQTLCSGPCNSNFQLEPFSAAIGSYDFLSIMHYGQYTFSTCPPSCNSSNPLRTIQCNSGYTQFQTQIGNRSYMTQLDAQGMAQRYGSPGSPYITSLNPASVVAGSATIGVTVTGANFFEGSPNNLGVQGTKVVFDGTVLPTTWVSNTQVSVQIPFSLLTTPGTVVFKVQNDPVAGGDSVATTFAVTQPPCPSIYEETGRAVATLNDVNGDGHGDFVVTAPGWSGGLGRAVCYSGQQGSVLWTIQGANNTYALGISVANAGDVSGDGKDDVLVGSDSYSSDRGLVRLVNGATGGVIRTYFGDNSGDRFGKSVANAGDVDNDGIPDAIIGQPGFGANEGRIEIFSGANGALVFWAVLGAPGDFFGWSVGGGYDISGDGVADFIAGAPNSDVVGTDSGRVWAFSGNGGGALFTRDGTGSYDYLGTSVAMMPSTTGSSTAAAVIGAPERGSVTGSLGSDGYIQVIKGQFGLFGTTYTTVATYPGGTYGDRFGQSVAAAGDLDDDGYMDIVVGATQHGVSGQLPTGPGYVRCISGKTGSTLDRLSAGSAGADYGFSVAGNHDTDGDGRPDLVIGAPFDDTPCTFTGTFYRAQPHVAPSLEKVLISEIYSGTPTGFEITNFDQAARTVTGWKLLLRTSAGTTTSQAIPTLTLQPGESIVVRGLGSNYAETPAGVQTLALFGSITSGISQFSVGLMNRGGIIVDEVRVASVNGVHSLASLGGHFRGHVDRHQTAPIFGDSHLERVWGLDSNSGGDWTAETARSMGLQNRSAGPRGFDPIPIPPVTINEVDDSPDYIELRATAYAYMDNWYLLCSAGHGVPHAQIFPFKSPKIMLANTYLVIGDGATQPVEMSGGIYINLASIGGGNIPWTSGEFDCALYDEYGRLVDLVRTTGHDDNVVHNHPRAPSLWSDFNGAAQRTPTGASIGRNGFGTDHDTSDDWRPYATRTMGSANSPSPLTFIPDPASKMDVRLDAGTGGGLTMILNAGAQQAGKRWSFALSVGHLMGTGPVLGLGPDAISNYLTLYNTPPWFGFLDARGTARIDIPSGTLPSGIQTDNLFILQDPITFAIEEISSIIEWDS